MTSVFQFTLVLDGVDDTTADLESALFNAGCDDALVNFKNATVYLDFDRSAKNLETAIISAIRAVESAGIGASIVSVAPEHLVSLSDIAKRSHLTRQAVSLFASGTRGARNFPKPVLKVTNKSPLWRWKHVVEWLYTNNKINDTTLIDSARVIDDMNIALELRDNTVYQHSKKILVQLKQ